MIIPFANGSFTTSQDGDGGTLNSGSGGTLCISAGQLIAATNNGGLTRTTLAPATYGVTQNGVSAGVTPGHIGTTISQARGSA